MRATVLACASRRVGMVGFLILNRLRRCAAPWLYRHGEDGA